MITRETRHLRISLIRIYSTLSLTVAERSQNKECGRLFNATRRPPLGYRVRIFFFRLPGDEIDSSAEDRRRSVGCRDVLRRSSQRPNAHCECCCARSSCAPLRTQHRYPSRTQRRSASAQSGPEMCARPCLATAQFAQQYFKYSNAVNACRTVQSCTEAV